MSCEFRRSVHSYSCEFSITKAVSRSRYLLYRGYGGFTRCEREQSSQIAVDRYGTHGGPPGRMILAQKAPRSRFGFLTELNALPPLGTNSRSFGGGAPHGTTLTPDSPRLA